MIVPPKSARRRRRLVFQMLAVFAVTGALLLLSCNNGFLSAKQPPNVILICIDTVRYDTFWLPELFGISDPLDTWTADSARFREVQAPAPWTVPSVASTLTGEYPAHHGAGRFAAEIANLDALPPAPLPKSVRTLPEFLGAAYESAGFITNTFVDKPSGIVRTNVLELVATADDIHSRAVAYATAQRQAHRPFLLYLHYMDAHDEQGKPLAELEHARRDLPPPVAAAVQQSSPRDICRNDPNGEACVRYSAYAGAVLRVRQQVGLLLNELERQRLLTNSVVIVFSDHGEEFFDHAEAERIAATDPRGGYGFGHGHSLYQELLHVPMFVWNEKLTPRDIDTPISLVDVTPTLLDWIGVKPPPGVKFDGVALPRPRAIDDESKLRSRVLFSSAVAFGPPQIAARIGNMKRIIRTVPNDRQLFSLSDDALEDHPKSDDADGLDHAILAYAASRTTEPLQSMTLSPEQLRRLKGIGYLTHQ